MRGYAVSDRNGEVMPQEGTPFRRIRMDDDLWERLDKAAKAADPDSNRSAVLRRLARWFVGDIDEIPARPKPRERGE
jgi:Ribbon-helix-helix protein, copG family